MSVMPDLAVDLFWALVDRHIAEQPECLQFVDESLLLRIDALIEGRRSTSTPHCLRRTSRSLSPVDERLTSYQESMHDGGRHGEWR